MIWCRKIFKWLETKTEAFLKLGMFEFSVLIFKMGFLGETIWFFVDVSEKSYFFAFFNKNASTTCTAKSHLLNFWLRLGKSRRTLKSFDFSPLFQHPREYQYIADHFVLLSIRALCIATLCECAAVQRLYGTVHNYP